MIRVLTHQRDEIAVDTASCVVWNSDAKCFYVYIDDSVILTIDPKDKDNIDQADIKAHLNCALINGYVDFTTDGFCEPVTEHLP